MGPTLTANLPSAAKEPDDSRRVPQGEREEDRREGHRPARSRRYLSIDKHFRPRRHDFSRRGLDRVDEAAMTGSCLVERNQTPRKRRRGHVAPGLFSPGDADFDPKIRRPATGDKRYESLSNGRSKRIAPAAPKTP